MVTVHCTVRSSCCILFSCLKASDATYHRHVSDTYWVTVQYVLSICPIRSDYLSDTYWVRVNTNWVTVNTLPIKRLLQAIVLCYLSNSNEETENLILLSFFTKCVPEIFRHVFPFISIPSIIILLRTYVLNIYLRTNLRT